MVDIVDKRGREVWLGHLTGRYPATSFFTKWSSGPLGAVQQYSSGGPSIVPVVHCNRGQYWHYSGNRHYYYEDDAYCYYQ